jgi:hypothetical protein
MSMVSPGVLIGHVFVIIAIAIFVPLERMWRWRWREVSDGSTAALAGGGAYRSGGEVPRFRRRAPTELLVAAFLALLLGELFIPLALVSVFALLSIFIFPVLFFTLLFLVPSLAATGKLFLAGLSLLRRDLPAYDRARSAARWSLAVSIVYLAMIAPLVGASFCRGTLHADALWPIGMALTGIVEARLLFRVARKWKQALSTEPSVL